MNLKKIILAIISSNVRYTSGKSQIRRHLPDKKIVDYPYMLE